MMMPKGKKQNILHFKVSDEELEKIQLRREMLGTKNLSSFLRDIALNGYVLQLDHSEIHLMNRLLSNIANNVNQIAARVNVHGPIYETELRDMKDSLKQISVQQRQILSKLNAIRSGGRRK